MMAREILNMFNSMNLSFWPVWSESEAKERVKLPKKVFCAREIAWKTMWYLKNTPDVVNSSLFSFQPFFLVKKNL